MWWRHHTNFAFKILRFWLETKSAEIRHKELKIDENQLESCVMCFQSLQTQKNLNLAAKDFLFFLSQKVCEI